MQTLKKGKNKRGASNTPVQTYTLEDEEFHDLRIIDDKHRAHFARIAKMGTQSTRFASEEVVELGTHDNVLALTKVATRHVCHMANLWACNVGVFLAW